MQQTRSNWAREKADLRLVLAGAALPPPLLCIIRPANALLEINGPEIYRLPFVVVVVVVGLETFELVCWLCLCARIQVTRIPAQVARPITLSMQDQPARLAESIR